MVTRETTRALVQREIADALHRGGYSVQTRVHVGERLGGHEEIADFTAERAGGSYVVRLMTKYTPGTSEEKVPFEVISLDGVVRSSQGAFRRGYLVLAGDAWTIREFYVAGGLNEHLVHTDLVTILPLEAFLARASASTL